ncbi:MAG: 3-phosphoshikimate 1-carboxyvinyltransferase [Coriobacteriales bacterium]|nr:3-phosphoshikimate 1-carboxyvinyltransferase [Coriobacteriales bacterium]
METLVTPSSLQGSVNAIASKSMAHRLLILSALCEEPCELVCNTTSQDIEATRDCLAGIWQRLHALDKEQEQERLQLDCAESGSTLRFLLPVVCALGISARLVCHGRLSQRPLAPLDEQLRAHGAHLEWNQNALEVDGALRGGTFVMPGNVSSQYVSGLLLAAPLLREPTVLLVKKPVESRPYITLTINALGLFGADLSVQSTTQNGVAYERYGVQPRPLVAPRTCVVEGDWSNAAFWLAAGALEREGLTVTGLDLASAQGDRAVLAALTSFGARIARKGSAARATKDTPRAATLDVSAIPDLVPPLAAVAATAPGTSRFLNAGRLRLKESDRLASVTGAINAMGGSAHVCDDDLVVEGTERLRGGVVDAHNDHRIAMMAAIMATHATGPTRILGSECVAKSYPTFWEDYHKLGGTVA